MKTRVSNQGLAIDLSMWRMIGPTRSNYGVRWAKNTVKNLLKTSPISQPDMFSTDGKQRENRLIDSRITPSLGYR
jgi:hypothetical protein